MKWLPIVAVLVSIACQAQGCERDKVNVELGAAKWKDYQGRIFSSDELKQFIDRSGKVMSMDLFDSFGERVTNQTRTVDLTWRARDTR